MKPINTEYCHRMFGKIESSVVETILDRAYGVATRHQTEEKPFHLVFAHEVLATADYDETHNADWQDFSVMFYPESELLKL